MILTSYKREYYILAGKVGMLELLEEKGIRTSKLYLLIISEDSKLGKLIKKEIERAWARNEQEKKHLNIKHT